MNQQRKTFALLIVLFLLQTTLIAQKNDSLTYSRTLNYIQFWDEMLDCDDSIYKLENALIIVHDTNRICRYYNDSLSDVTAAVYLKNITFVNPENKSTETPFSLTNYHFKEPFEMSDVKGIRKVSFSNCFFDKGLYLNCNAGIRLYECEVNNGLDLESDSKELNNSIHIESCKISFSSIQGSSSTQDEKEIKAKIISSNENGGIYVGYSKFASDSKRVTLKLWHSKVKYISIDSCIFDIDVAFSRNIIGGQLAINDTKFNGDFDFSKFRGPAASFIDMKFNQFHKSLSVFGYVIPWVDWNANYFYFKRVNTFNGLDTAQIDNVKKYDKLIAIHTQLLHIYKERGDLESANLCYISMKDVQTRHLEYIYKKNGGIEELMYWKLNVFLKYFAKYGTSPARAITVSLWVILIFACFYFFLYSNWDGINRSFLIKQHRKLLEYFNSEQKLEDFYADNYKEEFQEYETYKHDIESSKVDVPFFINVLGKPLYYASLFKHNAMTWLYQRTEILQGRWVDLSKSRKVFVGITVSLSILVYLIYLVIIRFLNSLILSINTFSTLGFGDIPVKSWTRYIAILEGFLGWFLLSIFSVSLIGQILQS